MRPGFTLSELEYDLIWSDLGFAHDLMRYPVHVPSHGVTVAERDGLRADVYKSLQEREILRDGQLDPELIGLLTVLANPTLAVDLVGLAEVPLRAVAAHGPVGHGAGGAHGTGGHGAGDGVLATIEAGELRLWPIKDGTLVPPLMDLLPENGPGPGRSVSVPLDTLRRVEAGPDPSDEPLSPWGDDSELDDVEALRRLGVAEADAGLVIKLADQRTHSGQFGVSVATRGGGPMRRAESVVSWFDTPQGRYLLSSDGSWITITPAGSDRLATRINEVISGLTN